MRFVINDQEVDLSKLNDPRDALKEFQEGHVADPSTKEAFYAGWKAALHAVGVAFAKAASTPE